MYTLDFIRFLLSLGAKKFLYPLSGTIPPQSSSPQTLLSRVIQNDMDFLCLSVSMIYNTLSAADTDSGVNTLTAIFGDGASQLPLCDDWVDLATVAAPGRQRTVGVSGDPSQGLYIPGYPWMHLYKSSGAIKLTLQNSSTQSIGFASSWDGYKVPVQNRDKLLAVLNPMGDIPSMPQA